MPDLFDFFTAPGEQPEETVTGSLARVRHFGDLARQGRLDALAAIDRMVAEVDTYLARQAAVRAEEVSGNREGRVSRDPRSTSASAARRVAPRAGSQRGRVLTAIVEFGGLTDYELSEKLSLLDNSIRPRRSELQADSYVVDSGRIRQHRGSAWAVWQATPKGLDWYREHGALSATFATPTQP
jgi:hypothetical protein